MIIDEEVYLEHHGVKGMHWGVRGTRRSQKVIDRINRQATGGASGVDKLLNANRGIFTQKGANKVLQRGANSQAKVKAGKLRVGNALLVAQGVRVKDLNYHKAPAPTKREEKKAAKADAKWQKNIYSVHGAIAVHNKVADKMNGGVLDELNNRPEFKNHVDKGGQLIDVNTGQPVGKVGRKYLSEYNKLVEHHTARAVKEVHGVSPSGKLKASLDTSDKNQWKVRVSPTSVKHGIAGVNDIKPDPMAVMHGPELLMNVNHSDAGHFSSHQKIKEESST